VQCVGVLSFSEMKKCTVKQWGEEKKEGKKERRFNTDGQHTNIFLAHVYLIQRVCRNVLSACTHIFSVIDMLIQLI